MMALWKNGPSFVKDILEEYQEPRPAYNTVSTITRILQKKGFVGHQSFSKSHQYFAKVSKDEYREYALAKLVDGYFNGSAIEVTEYFVQKELMPEISFKRKTQKPKAKAKSKPKVDSEEDQLDLFF